MMHNTVFLFDVDNTLLDNDRVQADLHVHIGIEHGIAARNRYWEIFEKLRDELGYADYLGALERYPDRPDAAPHRLAGHRAPHRHPTAPGSGSPAPHLGSHRPPLRPTASRSCAPPAPASPVDKPAPAAAARAVQTAARSDQQRRPGHQPRLAHLFASPCWIASQQS